MLAQPACTATTPQEAGKKLLAGLCSPLHGRHGDFSCQQQFHLSGRDAQAPPQAHASAHMAD